MEIFRCDIGFGMFDFEFMRIKNIILSSFLFCLVFSCKENKGKTEISNVQNPATKIGTSKRVQKKGINDCGADNKVSTLGIGLIIVPDKFAIYNDSLLTDRLADIDVYNEDMNSSPVCSMFFFPEYGIMHFICLSKTKKYYKVLNGNSEVKYLPVTKSYSFLSWDKYILQSMGVRRIIDHTGKITTNQPLRVGPDRMDTLSVPKGYELFCPMQVKGDWLQVTYDCFYNAEDNKHEGEPCSNYIKECTNPLSGWIKWKDGNKLLIDILLTD